MPEDLLNEIREKLVVGRSPHEIAEELGSRARLDYGEICSIRSVAEMVQRNLALR